MVSSKRNIMPVAGILSGALVWGLIWYPFRVLQADGVSGPEATFISYLLAMLFGAFMLPRVWSELPKADWWAVLLVFSAGWANFGYVLAMLHGIVMRVLLLFYLAPVWTILFSYWLLNERLNRYGYSIIALSLCGAFIMLWEPRLGMPFPKNLSEWTGLSAGMGFALSNVISRRTVSLSVEAKSVSIWFGTVALVAPLIWWQGGLGIAGGLSWLILGLLGVALCACSFAVQYGVTHMPANRATLLFLSELVVAAIASYFLVDETMGMREWAGALLIVSASLMSGKLYAENEISD